MADLGGSMTSAARAGVASARSSATIQLEIRFLRTFIQSDLTVTASSHHPQAVSHREVGSALGPAKCPAEA